MKIEGQAWEVIAGNEKMEGTGGDTKRHVGVVKRGEKHELDQVW